MANRRMFSKEVMTDDWFTDMPMGAKLLYVYLSLEADDDGFITSVNMALTMSGASKDDLKILIAKNYIIEIREGLKLIKHWKVNNYIQKDRYNPSRFHDELRSFNLKKDGSYTTETTDKPALDTKCIQNVSTGKDSIGKVSTVKDSIDKFSSVKRKYKEGVDCLALTDEYAKLKQSGQYEGTLKDYLTEKGAYDD